MLFVLASMNTWKVAAGLSSDEACMLLEKVAATVVVRNTSLSPLAGVSASPSDTPAWSW